MCHNISWINKNHDDIFHDDGYDDEGDYDDDDDPLDLSILILANPCAAIRPLFCPWERAKP